MTDLQRSSVWDELDSLTDDELRHLTTAALTVLGEHADAHLEPAVNQARDALAADTRAVLAEEGLAVGDQESADVVSDRTLSRSLSLSLLKSVGASPLRPEVEQLYERLRDMMVLDAGLLLGGAVLVLVLKLKRVRIGNADIEFYELKAELLEAVRSFLGNK